MRSRAGNPGYRSLAEAAGYSATTLSDAAAGRRLPSLPVVLAYVEACGGDRAQWERRWTDVAADVAARCASASPAEHPPYLGLASFQPTDAARFFGRERLVAQLTERLSGANFLAVVGASGSGKSSLLRAGLIPALTGPDGPATAGYHLMTPGTHPLDAIAQLPDGNARRLIAVDQFEEVFTVCRDEAQRTGFVDALLDAARDSAIVVVALRADFFGHCSRHARLATAVEGATALVGPMTGQELGQAVTGPAMLAGLSVERALLTKVQADAGTAPGALPMVSHALLETWRQRQGTQLTLAGYLAAGGVEGAIARTAERVYGSLDPEQRKITRHLLLRLIALGEGTEDTRRRVTRTELDADDNVDIIERLTRARLLVVSDTTVEIAHEALIRAWPRLRQWLGEDREALRVHRQLTEAAAIWTGLGREPGALLRGARLAVTREWAVRQGDAGLTTTERAFLDASTAAECAERAGVQRRARQLRLLAAGLAAMLTMALIAGGTAVWQWRRAVAERQTARSRELAVGAIEVARTDAPRAMQLAVAAYRTAPTVEARGALLSLASQPANSGRLVHNGLVKDVAFSPDGQMLVTGTSDVDGRVTVWDVARRKPRAVVSLPKVGDAARAVAFDPDGRLVASGGLRGDVILWDARSGAEVRQLGSHSGAVGGVAFSPDGRLLASVGEDHEVAVRQVSDGALVARFTGHGGKQSRIAFGPDGSWVVVAGDDGSAVVWSISGHRRLRTLKAGARPVIAVAVSPDGSRIATAGDDGSIWIWGPDLYQPQTTLLGHTDRVAALAFSHDGATLVSAGRDAVVNVWDAARGVLLTQLHGQTAELYAVAISPDGATIAAASRDQGVLLWDRSQMPLIGAGSEVDELSLSPDGATLAASSTGGTSVLWDLRTRQQRAVRLGDTPAPAASTKSTLPLVVTHSGKDVLLWDAGSAEPVRQLAGQTDQVMTTALDPIGRSVASGAGNRWVRVWDVGSGVPLDPIRQSGMVRRVTFDRSGQTLLSAAEDGTVSFLDRSGRTTRSLRTQPHLTDAALSPDGRLLAIGDAHGEMTLRDTDTGALLTTIHAHTGAVDALAFSPDGRLLASGGQDKNVILWDVPTRQIWATLVGHDAGVQAAVWSPRGDTLYTGSMDRTVIAWRVRPEQAMSSLCDELRSGFPDRPTSDCPLT